MEFRMIVCGGVDFDDYELLCSRLDSLIAAYGSVTLVSGHARGADTLAERYAAEWSRYGKAAGPIRNRAMLDYASEKTPVVTAFWDGRSRGTGNMLKQARAACHIVSYERKA